MNAEASVTHRYLTAAGSALQDPRHVTAVIDDQGNRSSWACAACPNRGAHAYYEYAHKMAQGHAAQCTALIEEPADEPATKPSESSRAKITGRPFAFLMLFLYSGLFWALAFYLSDVLADLVQWLLWDG